MSAPRTREEYDAQKIAQAVYFTATLFRGREYGYVVEKADSQAAAEALACTMVRRFGGQRLPAVYAITPKGDSIFVRGLSRSECGI